MTKPRKSAPKKKAAAPSVSGVTSGDVSTDVAQAIADRRAGAVVDEWVEIDPNADVTELQRLAIAERRASRDEEPGYDVHGALV